MIWINFIFRSKAGQAMLAVVVIGLMIAEYKFRISSLQGKLDRAIAEKNTVELRHNICEADLGQVKTSVTRQNQMIDDLKTDNERLAKEAVKAVNDSFTKPEVIERVMNQKPGYEELNRFLEELKGGMS